MKGQQDDRRNPYSSYWSTYPDSGPFPYSYTYWYLDSYSYSYSGSYPDSNSYSDVYSKEEETPTSKDPEFPDKMNDEVSGRMNIFSATTSGTSPSPNGVLHTGTTTRVNNPQKAGNVATLTVILPLVAVAVFALLLVVSLTLLWKKTLKRESSKQVSKSSHNNAILQGAVEGTTKPREHHSIELPLSSLEHRFSGGNGKVEEGPFARGNTYVEEAEYLELDEDIPEMYQKTIFKVEGYQPGSEYMDLGSNSANASVYEQLNHQRRRYEIDNISPNDKKDIQPQ